MDLIANIRDLGREVTVNMLAGALLFLGTLLYSRVGEINKDLLVVVMLILGIISLGTTLWIDQNRRKERFEAASGLEAERKDHKREVDAATKALEDLTDKYDTTKRELDEARKSLDDLTKARQEEGATEVKLLEARKVHRQELDTATKALEDLTHKWENKEFEFLIAPLYKQFFKFPGQKSLGSFTHMLSTPPAQWNSPLHEGMTFADAKNKEFPGAKDAVNSTIDVMLSHLELAQKPLQDLIGQYLELRKNSQAYGSKYYDVAEKLVEEIAKLVNTRYFELIK